MHRRFATALLVTTVAVSGCAASTPAAGPSAPAAPARVPEGTTGPSATESALPGSPSPASTAAAPAPSPSPARPAFTYDVVAAQRTLASLRYYAGAVDGRRGPALRSAVMAFQKVQGLGADGTVGPKTLAALSSPRQPALRDSGPADRVEVDLTRQVLYVVRNGTVARILPVSSGNGRTYEQKSGGTAKALTPVGFYRVQRRIVGERVADLGTLYDPQYFYRGWAIHGSNSVPAGPASHGCVRVTRADAKYLLDAIGVGTSVHLYGGTHTFTAGSSAPGTNSPTGDTAGDTAPEPTEGAEPGPSAEPGPASPRPAGPSPSPRPASPSATPRPAGPSSAPTSASPAPSPRPASPKPSPRS